MLRLGAASWSYPGWANSVWKHGNYEAKLLSRYGLSAYSQHPLLGCVEMDHSWYKPPSLQQYRDYASQLPPSFSMLAKTWRDITLPGNEAYLNPEIFREKCLLPFINGLGENAGPLLLAFQAGAINEPTSFLAQLAEFLSDVPEEERQQVKLTLEIREPKLLSGQHRQQYGRLISDYGIAHSFIHHPSMPPLVQQAQALAGVHQPWLVVRWMLQHGMSHDEAKRQFQPFARLQAADIATRQVVIALTKKALNSDRRAWLIAGNKAEGCAPATLFTLAGALATN